MASGTIEIPVRLKTWCFRRRLRALHRALERFSRSEMTVIVGRGPVGKITGREVLRGVILAVAKEALSKEGEAPPGGV